MKNKVLYLLLLLVFSCKNQYIKYDLAIINSTIIDVKNSKLIPNQTVYILDDRIAKVTSAKINEKEPADIIINGKGKYILPGFWDMHVHATWKEELDKTVLPYFLKYGITGVRDMGGRLDILNAYKENAKSKPTTYPNLYGSGPIIDGEHPIHPDFSVSVTVQNYKKVLDSLVNKHVDFFKVYSLLDANTLDSIAAYAKAKSIDFAGHISEYVTADMASNLGQKSFEHLNILEDLTSDSIQLTKTIRTIKDNGTWLCPTLIIYQREFEIDKGEFFHHPLYSNLDLDLKTEWNHLEIETLTKNKTEITTSKLELDKRKQLVKLFYDQNIPTLLGTDFAGMPFIYPGFSFHEEMQLLEDIGIPQHDILKMACYNPSIFLGISKDYGTIENNKIADLIILSQNPLVSIKNTLAIEAVIKSGALVSLEH